ncbi:hypothetical protein Q5752_003193 [Cryptotrichosporon argae]
MPVLDKLAHMLSGSDRASGNGTATPRPAEASGTGSSTPKSSHIAHAHAPGERAAPKPAKHRTFLPAIPHKPCTTSSVQLFSMFKAMAAGSAGDDAAMPDDVDSDEDEDGPLTIAARRSRGESFGHEVRLSASAVSMRSDDDALTVTGAQAVAQVEGEQGDEGEKKAQRRWMSDTVGGDVRVNEAMSSRFAALSMSNFSPLAEGEQGRKRSVTAPRRRPRLPSFSQGELVPSPESMSEDEHDSELDDGHRLHEADDSVSVDSASTGMTTPSVAPSAAGTHDEIADDEKLAVIIEEFGEVAGNMVNADGTPSESERLLAEVKGSLFKGVMMIGNLHLTTHRLLFHALLPPDEVFVAHKPNLAPETGAGLDDKSYEAARARAARPDILQAGPVTVHGAGVFKSRRRVWLELSPDMITSYPSADEAGRVRPLITVLLTSCLRLEPLDESMPCDFIITYEAPGGVRTSHFTVDTEQSAVNWRRQIEGAMFRHARLKFRKRHREAAMRLGTYDADETSKEGKEWTMMRCCVPLDRASVTGVSEYHSFATLVSLDIALDDHSAVTWHPETMAIGSGDLPMGEAPRGTMPLEAKAVKPHLPSLRQVTSDVLHRPHTPSHTPGSATPKRAFSISGALQFKAKDKSDSRSATPPAQAERDDKHRAHRQSTQWIDSSLPPRLARAGQGTGTDDAPSMATGSWCDGTGTGAGTSNAGTGRSCPEAYKPGADWRNSFTFTVAVLNEQRWFATALESAVAASAQRIYRPGAPKSTMRLDVGGYDCLAADDELDREAEARADQLGRGPRNKAKEHTASNGSSTPREVSDSDDEDQAGSALHRTRKEEKAAMAAKLFGLREEEGIWLKRCYVAHGVVPDRGHIILTPRYICFWRRATIGADIKYRFSFADVKSAEPHSASMAGFHGMALKLHGQHDLNFEFWRESSRDEVIRRIMDQCKEVEAEPPLYSPPTSNAAASPAPAGELAPVASRESSISGGAVDTSVERAFTAPLQLSLHPDSAPPQRRLHYHAADVLAPARTTMLEPRAFPDEALSFMPFIANKPMGLTKLAPRTFALLTIGSRGDVQPYIALGLRLMKDGHKVVIVTHDEFKKWIEGYGIEHRQAGGDPTALMKLSTEHKMFSPGFFKESLGSFRQWLDDLLLDAWNACHDADVLIESPSAMAGVHIAEARRIPYFRAFTMPWTRTTAYPQAFMVPAFEMGPSFNYSTYVLFDNIMWRATAGQINRWRRAHLGLKPTDMGALSVTKVPFLYNFSPAVVPKPLDWHDDITITGYWNLENSDTEWTPPDDLVAFMDKAKADGKALVYIGFGSIVVPRPNAMTKSIIKAVEKADVRAIIAKGWSSRGGDPAKEGEHIALPASCYGLDKVPHGWLFPKVQAALHHGGAGTVGASLRAGIPTLIKPWFGDQHFWAGRVQKLEVGLKVGSLKSDEIAAALHRATTDRVMLEKAARIGQRVRAENGVDEAVQAIQFNIVRAAADRRKMAWAR